MNQSLSYCGRATFHRDSCLLDCICLPQAVFSDSCLRGLFSPKRDAQLFSRQDVRCRRICHSADAGVKSVACAQSHHLEFGASLAAESPAPSPEGLCETRWMKEHESGAHGRVVLSFSERGGGLVTAAWGEPFPLPPFPSPHLDCYWEFLSE